jgi:hypothetical protein
MKKLTLIVMFLVLLVITIVIRDKSNNAQSDSGSAGKETYVSQVIINASWGEEPGQFGIYEPEEGPTLGPQALTIAPKGDIYIDDGYNGRIQKFSNNGELISIIPLSEGGIEICIDQSGNIYLYNSGIVPKRIFQYDDKGNLLKKYPILWDDLGMRVVGGARIFCDSSGRLFLCYRSDSLKVPMIFQVGTTEMVFSEEQQKATLREGFVGSNNVILNQGKIFQNKEGDLHLVDDFSRSVKKFSSYKMNLGQAGFTGVDEQMNIYTLKYDRGKDVEVMRKYNSAGDLITEFNIQQDYYVHAMRTLVLDEHGNVYVMSTSKDGLKIIKWSPEEGKK